MTTTLVMICSITIMSHAWGLGNTAGARFVAARCVSESTDTREPGTFPDGPFEVLVTVTGKPTGHGFYIRTVEAMVRSLCRITCAS